MDMDTYPNTCIKHVHHALAVKQWKLLHALELKKKKEENSRLIKAQTMVLKAPLCSAR
jgi:hypothetical protein